jgi:hypothetical protein
VSVDVDFRSYLLADTAITAITSVICLNWIPQDASKPFVWFQVMSSREEVGLDGEGGIIETVFAVECVSTSPSQVQSLAAAVRARCNGAQGLLVDAGTFVQGMFVEDASDDYIPKTQFEDAPISIVALEIQLFHE